MDGKRYENQHRQTPSARNMADFILEKIDKSDERVKMLDKMIAEKSRIYNSVVKTERSAVRMNRLMKIKAEIQSIKTEKEKELEQIRLLKMDFERTKRDSVSVRALTNGVASQAHGIVAGRTGVLNSDYARQKADTEEVPVMGRNDEITVESPYRARMTRIRETQGALEAKARRAVLEGGVFKKDEHGGTSKLRNAERAILSGFKIGKFNLGKKLGGGSQADVYLANDGTRDVALKILDVTGTPDDEGHSLIEESRRIASIKSPHIVKVFEFGQINYPIAGIPRKFVYCSMELMNGGSISSHLERHHPEGYVTGENKLVVIGSSIATALKDVHGFGLVHRDVKPKNVLCDGDGHFFLSDLGVSDGTVAERSKNGGTIKYVAPELLRSYIVKLPIPATIESDIFSLGATLYSLASGMSPLGARVKETRTIAGTKMTERFFTDLIAFPGIETLRSDLSEQTTRIINKMISVKPEERHRSATEAINDFLEIVQTDRISNKKRDGYSVPRLEQPE